MTIPSLGFLAASLLLVLAAGDGQAAERSLDKEVIIKASVDQAWQSWTTREGIVAFFAPDARIEPRVGGAFQIYIDPGAAPGSRGADDMRFMALQPRKMISFDWNAPPSLPELRQQRTFVTVRFAPVDAEHTRVSLHHSGWGDGGEWDRGFAYFDKAWGQVLGNLQQRYETGPKDWAPWLAQLEQYRRAQAAAGPASAASTPRP
ncbi:MAG: SRPBCC domain-containing protein [Burkholderiaceae bacterium]